MENDEITEGERYWNAFRRPVFWSEKVIFWDGFLSFFYGPCRMGSLDLALGGDRSGKK
jgi:hypothetical protein